MPDRIPIKTAREIGQKHNYDQVVIIARRVGENGRNWLTTWGRNKEHCDVAAKIRDVLERLESGDYKLVPTHSED